MAITSIHVDSTTYEEFGVGMWELPLHEPLEMRGLGKIVVLAGPNGGGKSRILRLVNQLMRKQLTNDQIDVLEHRIRHNQVSLDHWRGVLRRIEEEANPQTRDEKRSATESISSLESQSTAWKRELLARDVMTRSTADVPPVVFFVPSNYRLVDPGGSSDDEVKHRAARIRQGQGSEGAETNAPAYAREVLRASLWGWNQQCVHDPANKSQEEKEADSLKDLVSEILGPAFNLDIDQTLNITIGGRRDYPTILSPGQQILFQFVCLLHAQGASLGDCIVLMDEPENHLHPAAITQIVEKLRGKISTGQLWIATHSVPLIAQLLATETDCLWYVDGGKAKRAGRSPESVLEGLLGGPEGARHINELTLMPAQFAALRFLSECLRAPNVVGPNSHDPQLSHIGRILRDRIDGSRLVYRKQLRIVDFGAGKARLLSALNVMGDTLDYFAYERDPTLLEHCRREVLRTSTNNAAARCFSDIHELTSSIDRGSVDVVVMCNVLHEVPPDEWLRLFGADGQVSKLLHQSGYLLLVEDYGIPIGERAHEFGFLLLDGPELRCLFQIGEEDMRAGAYLCDRSTDPKYKDRLAAHLIRKDCVERVTPHSQIDAIRALRDRSMTNVERYLRDDPVTSRTGRSYALTAQLLANATIWLSTRGIPAAQAEARVTSIV